MRKFWIGLVLFGLTGCATEGVYVCANAVCRNSDASLTLAKCRAQSDTLPTSQTAVTNPFFAAASQESYVTDCMAASGYRVQ